MPTLTAKHPYAGPTYVAVDRASLRPQPYPEAASIAQWMTVPDALWTAPAKGGVPALSVTWDAVTAPVKATTPVKAPPKKPAVKGKPIPTMGAAAKIKRVGNGYHVTGQLGAGKVKHLGVSAEAQQAWQKMQQGAAASGIVLDVVYDYRSVAEQRRLWLKSDRTGRWVARPGKSEHHTGLAFDINTTTKSFGSSKAYRWMKQHAYKYGFVQSMSYEPWHWRYDPEAVRLAVARVKR
jgi:zinc D-Ala-D-Ala carboxypeptidase